MTMNSPEFARSSGPEVSPEGVMEDLMMQVQIKLGEASQEQEKQPGLVWLLRGSDEETGEEVVWYRLGETREIGTGQQERFDIGVVVDDPHAVPPVTAQHGKPSFFIRKDVRGDWAYTRVTETNAYAVAGIARSGRAHRPVVSDLQRKLNDYFVQPMRLRIVPHTSLTE